jgi:hypothetical protein
MPPRDVPQQYLMDVRLGLRLDVAAVLQQQADHIVRHVHGACVENAGYKHRPDQVRRRPPVAGARLHWRITGSAAA